MWIQGRRRGGAKALAAHLRKTDENETVAVRALDGVNVDGLTDDGLEQALRQMEAIGHGKGDKRNLYHAILAPAYGETLDAAQQKVMVDFYAQKMGFEGHQRAIVEHWKHGKQHFHLVFNIIDPATSKTHELKWTKRREWQISRDLEEMFGHSTPQARGKASQTWETQRGKRTGVDPQKMRKTVTEIFHKSRTAQEFAAALERAGYVLTRGQRNQFVLVDRFGDTHGLMRRIEGQKVADLRRKFPDIETIKLPDHSEVVRTRKVKSLRKAKSVKDVRSAKGVKIARRKIFGPPTTPKRPVVRTIGGARMPKAGLGAGSGVTPQASTLKQPQTVPQKQPVPHKTAPGKKGWPEAAIIDWKVWGHLYPSRFFAVWPDLAPEGGAGPALK